MPTHRLDVPALFRALDGRRAQYDLSWRSVADEVGVSNSTFSRMADGRSPDADALCSMIVWLGLSLRQFVAREERLPPVECEPGSPSVTRDRRRGA